jgi:hypothetical protein
VGRVKEGGSKNGEEEDKRRETVISTNPRDRKHAKFKSERQN